VVTLGVVVDPSAYVPMEVVDVNIDIDIDGEMVSFVVLMGTCGTDNHL
jgi:hypothetical protein